MHPWSNALPARGLPWLRCGCACFCPAQCRQLTRTERRVASCAALCAACVPPGRMKLNHIGSLVELPPLPKSMRGPANGVPPYFIINIMLPRYDSQGCQAVCEHGVPSARASLAWPGQRGLG